MISGIIFSEVPSRLSKNRTRHDISVPVYLRTRNFQVDRSVFPVRNSAMYCNIEKAWPTISNKKQRDFWKALLGVMTVLTLK